MYDTIKWLHVEPTTRCNAWCSFCPRNKNGYGLSDFELEDLIPKRLDTIIGKMPKLEIVQFCGTLGDPCASKLINEQLKVVKKYNLNLQLHTNGSLRNKDWWANLAKLFGDKISVWFAIDGLDDTHKKYRQATDWHKIIENAKSFIEAGGHAVWQFIPFAHNEHQIRDCMRLSTSLGFARFEFIKDARYLDKAYDYQTGETTDISPWSKHNKQWSRKGKILNKFFDCEDHYRDGLIDEIKKEQGAYEKELRPTYALVLDDILTKSVPIREIIIPTPAIDIGSKIGPIPPKSSCIAPPISLIT